MKRNLLVAAAGALVALATFVTPMQAGWKDDAATFRSIFKAGGADAIYYEDGSFEVTVDGHHYTGCETGADCDDATHVEGMLYMPKIGAFPDVRPTIQASGAYQSTLTLDAVTPGIERLPSIDPDGCQPLPWGEDCEFGEYAANTWTGPRYPDSK